MAEVLKRGEGQKFRCTGAMGHGYNGCGAVLGIFKDDLFTVASLADPSNQNLAYKCPQCGVVSDYENYNRVKE